MNKFILILIITLIPLCIFSQEIKIFEYSNKEVLDKPKPTEEFEDWLFKNNEKIGKAAPANSKKTTKVTLVFNVDKEGNINKPLIWRGIGQGYDEYAAKLLKNNPNKWIAGRNPKGEAIETKVYYQLDFIKNNNRIMDIENNPILKQ